MNLETRKSLELKLDYNNMMAEFVGKEGFTEEELEDGLKQARRAYRAVMTSRGDGFAFFANGNSQGYYIYCARYKKEIR